MKINRSFEKGNYVQPISGKEFKESGMLWFVNSILHTFGMALTWNPETDAIEPAITKFRGFEEKYNDQGYRAVTEYMKDNAVSLLPDVTEEIEI